MASNVLNSARAYVKAGLSVIPIRPCASCKDPAKGKEPALPTWRHHQVVMPLPDELEKWFGEGTNGIAIITGQVSGGLEVLDFEDAALFEQWRAQVAAEAPGLLQQLPVIQTPRPGRHVYYRCAEAEGSRKLARTADGRTLIETKGEGGYVLAPGSPAACHPSGRTYEPLIGSPLTAIPEITPGERDLLLGIARSFNLHEDQEEEKPATRPQPENPARTSGGAGAYERCRAYLAEVPGSVSGHRGHDQAFEAACIAVHGFRLDNPTALEVLRDWNPKCTRADGSPYPWSDQELRHKIEQARAKGSYRDLLNEPARHWDACTKEPNRMNARGSTAPNESATKAHAPATTWPAPMAADAFHGLPGELVHVLEPHTEGDPAALLGQMLVAFGNVIGRSAYFSVGAKMHFLHEFLLLVGATGSGRKGASWSSVANLMEVVDPVWAEKCLGTGLCSGEGLIWRIRDPSERLLANGKVHRDPGVADKRLLSVEEEFGQVLVNGGRQGNTLSTHLRLAWDGNRMETLGKGNPAAVAKPHVSIIAHSTSGPGHR